MTSSASLVSGPLQSDKDVVRVASEHAGDDGDIMRNSTLSGGGHDLIRWWARLMADPVVGMTC